MNYYKLVKNNKKIKLKSKIKPTNGCSINSKNNIIIYEDNLKQFVINKKLTIMLNHIILLYKLYNEDSSDENREALILKTESFKKLLFKNYRMHLNEETFKKFSDQIISIEKQININIVRKNRQI